MEVWGRESTPFGVLYVLSIRPKIWGARDGVIACREGLDYALANGEGLQVPDLIPGGCLVPGAEIGAVLQDWNAASGEDQARCHIPRHGLATVTDGVVDWFATICFECANVYIDGPCATEGHRIIQFNGCPLETRLDTLLKPLK